MLDITVSTALGHAERTPVRPSRTGVPDFDRPASRGCGCIRIGFPRVVSDTDLPLAILHNEREVGGLIIHHDPDTGSVVGQEHDVFDTQLSRCAADLPTLDDQVSNGFVVTQRLIAVEGVDERIFPG